MCRILYSDIDIYYSVMTKVKNLNPLHPLWRLTFERAELYLIRRGMVFSMAHFVLSMLWIKRTSGDDPTWIVPRRVFFKAALLAGGAVAVGGRRIVALGL